MPQKGVLERGALVKAEGFDVALPVGVVDQLVQHEILGRTERTAEKGLDRVAYLQDLLLGLGLPVAQGHDKLGRLGVLGGADPHVPWNSWCCAWL